MNDIDRAKQLLQNEGFTCVLCMGEQVYASHDTGISPMLDLLDSGTDCRGYAAADKIVGKAAAMLFVLAGAASVYAEVLSESGKQVLEHHGIPVSYGTLTERIINRRGDGICPMEAAVAETDDPSAAIAAVRSKREQLRKGVK